MKRGEIWWVNFDAVVGAEVKKSRPAVIVSNDMSNAHSRRVQVVPATGQVDKLYPPECLIRINDKPSKIMADQIMTVAKERLYNPTGAVTREEMQDIERVLALQLGM